MARMGDLRVMSRLVRGTHTFAVYHSVVVERGSRRWLDRFECDHDDHLRRADAESCADARAFLAASEGHA